MRHDHSEIDYEQHCEACKAESAQPNLTALQELDAYISYLRNRIYPQDLIANDLQKIRNKLGRS